MTKRLDLKTFKLTDGDIIFDENKSIVMVSDIEEVEQAIKNAINQNIEAWIFNIIYGLDYKEMLRKGISDDETFELFNNSLAQEERVSRIENFKVTTENRERTITFTVILINGEEVEVTA